jgi:hypothetical protein
MQHPGPIPKLGLGKVPLFSQSPELAPEAGRVLLSSHGNHVKVRPVDFIQLAYFASWMSVSYPPDGRKAAVCQ